MDRTVALASLRRMVAADERPALSTDDLDALLDQFALVDVDGRLVTDVGWVPTWDLNQAAAEGWRAKAAKVAGDYTFSADDASYSKGDVLAHMLQMAAEYAAKSVGVLSFAADRSYPPYNAPRLLVN